MIFTLLTHSLFGQVVTGKVADSSSGEPLEYVSIGVIGTPVGCITDKGGNFTIDLTLLDRNASVRISMISYVPQSFSIEEFILKADKIALAPAPTQLNEVVIKPSGRIMQIGASNFDRKALWGWVGTDLGKGREKGTLLKLGKKKVRLLSLHANVFSNSFDTCFFRLHIRKLLNGLPSDELLGENIIIPIHVSSGWDEVDLSKYNLEFKDDIALTLEWLKIGKLIEDTSLTENGKKRTPKIYFNLNMKRKGGGMFVRQGFENTWQVAKRNPTLFLTVQEIQ